MKKQTLRRTLSLALLALVLVTSMGFAPAVYADDAEGSVTEKGIGTLTAQGDGIAILAGKGVVELSGCGLRAMQISKQVAY